MPEIVSFETMSNYLLKVSFNNGSTVILNMKPKLNTIRFQQLQDKKMFNSAVTDGYSIRWSELMEISVTEIFEMAQINYE